MADGNNKVAIIVAIIGLVATVSAAIINKAGTNNYKKEESAEAKCPPWYEGKDCQTEMRQKFYGSYVGNLSNPALGKFPATVVLGPGNNGIQSIRVNWGIGTDGNAIAWDVLLSGSSTINVPIQHIKNSPVTKGVPYTDEGLGKLVGDQLTLNWVQKFPTGKLDWIFVANK